MTRINASKMVIEAGLGLGLRLTEAVRLALGVPLARFAEERGFRADQLTMCLLGYKDRAYPTIRDEVAGSLGIERTDLDGWIADESAVREAA